MKKKIIIALMMMVATTGGAQGWQKITTEADELKGQEAGECMMYSVEGMGDFVMWSWDEPQYRLISTDAQFNIDAGMAYVGVMVLVGLYDGNGKMKEKFEMWLDREGNRGNQFIRTRDAGFMNNPTGQKKKVKKIFKHLQGNDGYVRIVAPRYNTTDFDIKITPYKE